MRDTKQRQQTQKAFEASCNHLGLTELEREEKRIPWQGCVRWQWSLCSAEAQGMQVGVQGDLCHPRPPRTAPLCTPAPPGDSRSLQLEGQQRNMCWFKVSCTCWENAYSDLNLPTFHTNAVSHCSQEHKSDSIQFQLNTVLSSSLRISSLVCG